MNEVKLFCFPYAGGSGVIYNAWQRWLTPGIRVVPVELAGRGKRINEGLYSEADDAISDAFRLIRDEIRQFDYALFGHSMGSMIAYGLAQRIREESLRPPLHLFFSGRGAPHIGRLDEKKFHLMSEEAFRKEVIGLGGTPPEFFDQPELRQLFLPVLRNDFRISETAPKDRAIRPLATDVTVLLGKVDDLTAEQCDGWKKHTSGLCTLHYFSGGHFFLHSEVARITKIIKETLVAASLPLPSRQI